MARAALAVAALLVAACLVATGGRATGVAKPRVGFVTYAGVVPTKRTLEGQTFAGFLKAEKELEISGRIVYVAPTQDPSGALTTLAREKYDLVIVALPRIDVVDVVARKFPHVRFFLIDVPPQRFRAPHEPPNVQGSIYRAEEAGYLAGYLGALMERRTPGKHAISAVGGIPYIGVNRWTVGYKAGARKADPAIAVKLGYSQDFANPAKCRRVAQRQIAEGSGVVFNISGTCGLGTLRAAKDEAVWGVGVDIDQAFLGPHVLTSAVVKLDAGVLAVVRRFTRGELAFNRDPVFNLHNGGVGLGRISPKVPRPLLDRLERIRAAIVAGRIRVPRPTNRPPRPT